MFLRTKYVTAILSDWIFQKADIKKFWGLMLLTCERKKDLEWARRAF